MPIYEYLCESCGKHYEQIRRMADADTGLQCPACRSEEVRRQLSSFATTSGTADAAPKAGGCGMGACGSGACAFGNN